MATKWITVGTTTANPELVEVDDNDRDVSEEAYSETWAQFR